MAAGKLPEQDSSSRHIPPEIAEEILVNLPIKSLLRFSTLSKSWNSMIHSDQRFIRRYRSRAALPGRERALIYRSTASLTSAATLPISSLLSNQVAANTTPLIIPFEIEGISEFSFLASCGELWCVEYNRSLFLWNPSMRTFKKLPNPSHLVRDLTLHHAFSFGVGYDSVEDDYKILKMRIGTYPELYSLRSDSWKTIQSFSKHVKHHYMRVVFLSGALYWVESVDVWPDLDIIDSFDLSTEKFAEVAQPPAVRYDMDDVMRVSVIKQKLCLHISYTSLRKYVVWVREDCESGESWIKMFDIDYSTIFGIEWRLDEGEVLEIWGLVVLYFDENGKILIDAMEPRSFTMITCMDGNSIPQIVYRCTDDFECLTGVLYVESLVSPATYCGRPCPPATYVVVDGAKQP